MGSTRPWFQTFFLGLGVYYLSIPALGADITAPYYFDSAQVLPKGVRTLRFNYLMGGANERFDSSGTSTLLGSSMNTGVSYREFVDGQDSPLEKGLLRGYLKQQGRELDSLAGETTGALNVEIDARVPILAWGMTDRWTMALAVPMVTIRTHIDTGFRAHGDLQGITDKMVTEGQGFKALEMKKRTKSPIAENGDKHGYNPLTPSSSYLQETSLGDIRLINKVRFLSHKQYALAFLNELTLPTGRRVDIDRIIDVPTGDGQFDLNFGVVGEYNMGPRTTLVSRLAYTWQAPDRVVRRIPQDSKALLSSDLDGQVLRKLGDGLYLSAGGSFELNRQIKLNTQYSFQYKERDEYEGNQYEAHRYDFLGQDSAQSLHALQLGVNFSTAHLFLSKQFPIPFDFNLMSAIPLAGRNVIKDPTVIMELGLFF
ncbi:MAG: hypothetical protein OXB88_00060 [Bacteriovoracales bacterium]|nr:hypothetical protein [Bacteriovoracales bacterium]